MPYAAVKRYRLKNIEEEKCIICGKELEDDNFNTRCHECKRWDCIRAIAYRAFMKDFK